MKTKGNIFTDIATAVKLTGEIRRARKAGAQIKPVYTVPVLKTGYWGWTMEFCLMRDRETERAVEAVFNTLPEPVQHFLTFTPKNPGDWAERARFWQQQLRPVLPSKMYHTIMARFIGWYIHCLRRRKEATAI